MPILRTTMQRNRQKGFTLIEIMIVIAIFVGMMVISMSGSRKRPENNLKSVLRKMSAGIRLSRDRARLNAKTYRILLDIDNQRVAFQVADRAGLVDTSKEIERANEEAKKKKDNKSKDSKADDSSPPTQELVYEIDPKIMAKGPLQLGDEIHIKQVEIANVKDPITSGQAFIHISSDGFVEASAIQFENKVKSIFTLVINPVTGQSEIIEREVALKESFESSR